MGDPEEKDSQNSYWVDLDEGADVKLRVPVRYYTPSGLPLWLGASEHDELLHSLSVARATGGSIFRVTPEQWQRVLDVVGGWPGDSQEGLNVQDTVRNRRSSGGQGFRSSAAERKAIELRAMALAEQYFFRTWSSVTDVSAHASFDLLCRRGEDELHVEVKGTTTLGESIVLTKNEVAHSRQASCALFLVSEIRLDRTDLANPIASGGKCTLFDPWQIDDHALKPLAYECRLNGHSGISLGLPNEKG